MTRALVLALLAVPALGVAQTPAPGAMTFSPDALAGTPECDDGARTITTTWNVGATVNSLGEYRVYASNKAPPAVTTGIRRCITGDTPTDSEFAALLGIDVVPTSNPQIVELPIREMIVDAANFTCTETSVQTIHVCVEYFDTGVAEPAGSAVGTFQFDPRKPAAPVGVNAEPGEGALHVSWTAGSGGAVDAVRYRVSATGPAADPGPHEDETPSSPHRLGNLQNGLTYSVTVTALSAAGTPGEASSPPASGTPTEVEDFWESYAKDGREQGGCASGPGGALALLAGSALLLRLRRRK
jgi:hypothetical protein